MITAGGENIAPVLIENNIKGELPAVVGNAMVVGDKQKYLTVLLTLKVEMDSITAQPTDRLDAGLIKWGEKLGVTGLKTVADFRNSDQKEVCITLISCIKMYITFVSFLRYYYRRSRMA